MNINTDAKQIEELLSRGVEAIYPTREFLEKRLKSGEQLTIYTGYDPTGPTLHIGHGITLLKLRQFQQLGHKIIMLIGDFTGMIGDPTDKSSVRQKLTREQVMENCKEYQRQAASVLDFVGENSVELKYNSEWFRKMTFEDVVELASHFTVPRLLERDMFQERLRQEKTVYLHEFLYPIMQGYDSVVMDVDGEVGGNDQTFNMLAGRTLMKDMENKEKFVVAMRLLTDTSGKKMGKTEGNMISLDDSPEEMYGKVMSWTDEAIINGFELCTAMPTDQIDVMNEEMKSGANPRDIKMRLASEVVKTFLDEDAAMKGQEHFGSVVQGKEKPSDMREHRAQSQNLVDVLVEAGLCPSKTDARRTIEQGGVKLNDQKVDSIDATIQPGDIVQKGKRGFVRIV
ncbi:MAG: tyrosine--tRNA ligase [Candidatus Magasanikbacteria bacterium]